MYSEQERPTSHMVEGSTCSLDYWCLSPDASVSSGGSSHLRMLDHVTSAEFDKTPNWLKLKVSLQVLDWESIHLFMNLDSFESMIKICTELTLALALCCE